MLQIVTTEPSDEGNLSLGFIQLRTHQHLQRNTTNAWYETDIDVRYKRPSKAMQFHAARNQAMQFCAARNQTNQWRHRNETVTVPTPHFLAKHPRLPATTFRQKFSSARNQMLFHRPRFYCL